VDEKYLKITIEIDEKKEAIGSFESNKSDVQNAGPAPQDLTTKSLSRGITEFGALHTDPNVIDGGTPSEHLLEELQLADSFKKRMDNNIINDAGPANIGNRE
jgi:hypothetical protein